MCRYNKTTYSCGHTKETCVFTSDRCPKIPCPPVELVKGYANYECPRCVRSRGEPNRESRGRSREPDVETKYPEHQRDERPNHDEGRARERSRGANTRARCSERPRYDSEEVRCGQNAGNFTPDFDPFYGQAGQLDEETYRQNALYAYRRKQEAEFAQEAEEAKRYARHRQSGGQSSRRAELEREQDRHEEERERMLDASDCGCRNCSARRHMKLNNRVYGWDCGNPNQQRSEEKKRYGYM